MNEKYYLDILCTGNYIRVSIIDNKKVKSEFVFDVLEKDELQFFNTLMKSHKYDLLHITWEDIRFLRKLGIRV